MKLKLLSVFACGVRIRVVGGNKPRHKYYIVNCVELASENNDMSIVEIAVSKSFADKAWNNQWRTIESTVWASCREVVAAISRRNSNARSEYWSLRRGIYNRSKTSEYSLRAINIFEAIIARRSHYVAGNVREAGAKHVTA